MLSPYLLSIAALCVLGLAAFSRLPVLFWPEGSYGLSLLVAYWEDVAFGLIGTHDVDLAAEWAAQIIVIKDGKTMTEGGPLF